MKFIFLQFLVCLAVLKSLASAQDPNLIEILTISTNPPNDAVNAVFPSSILEVETPIAIRYALLLAAGNHEVTAACDPIALSFFGTKDAIPKKFCSEENQLVLQYYILYRLFEVEFPVEALGLGAFLQLAAGLNPFDDTADETTLNGWANVKAKRLTRYFSNDGWNSLGTETKKNYRQQFQDTSKYSPVNNPFSNPDQLSFPLRWQPLTREFDFRGEFGIQVHVVPHIGIKAMPLALTREDIDRRKAAPLYSSPNRKRSIGKSDMRVAKELIDGVFERSRELTPQKIATAFWWDNKFVSLGLIAPAYFDLLSVNQTMFSRIFLGEMIAQHDAVLLAWKEKRRHDFVRPSTLIRNVLRGKKVRAFKGVGDGVGLVDAEEWEPVVPIQPHSEYPSASAIICKASLDQLDMSLKKLILKEGQSLPPFEFNITQFLLPRNPIKEQVTVRFETLRQAARNCGESRLDSGVHFAPSVPAGFKLAKGVGKIAYDHVQDLYNGKVPKNCPRCL